MAKMIYRKDTGDILGVHIFGLHAADLIHEASNAIATGQRVQVSCFVTHVLCHLECLADCVGNVTAPAHCNVYVLYCLVYMSPWRLQVQKQCIDGVDATVILPTQMCLYTEKFSDVG